MLLVCWLCYVLCTEKRGLELEELLATVEGGLLFQGEKCGDCLRAAANKLKKITVPYCQTWLKKTFYRIDEINII